MGKRKHSRSRSEETQELRKRLKKLEKKIKESKENRREEENTRRSSSPGTPPVPSRSTEEVEELTGDDIPDELLQALGKEGEDTEVMGEELQQQLVKRWTNIITSGLDKESRESLLKKYPTPANFPAAVPPRMNPEIQASLSESTIKRDKRIVARQSLLGKLMTALGRALTNMLKGNLNTKEMVEQLNDAAKLAAEVHHQDSASRKFFAHAGTSTVVKEAVKTAKTDEFLFGKSCGDQIKAAQTIKKQALQLKTPPIRQENWKSPLQAHQSRSGQPYRPPKTHPTQAAQRAQPVQRSQPGQRTGPKKKPAHPQKPGQTRYRRY